MDQALVLGVRRVILSGTALIGFVQQLVGDLFEDALPWCEIIGPLNACTLGWHCRFWLVIQGGWRRFVGVVGWAHVWNLFALSETATAPPNGDQNGATHESTVTRQGHEHASHDLRRPLCLDRAGRPDGRHPDPWLNHPHSADPATEPRTHLNPPCPHAPTP